MKRAEFQDWLTKVRMWMDRLFDPAKARHSPILLLDAKLVWEQDVSPRDAAKAYLNLDPQLFDKLVKLQREKER